jgi:hypothetical protein
LISGHDFGLVENGARYQVLPAFCREIKRERSLIYKKLLTYTNNKENQRMPKKHWA